MSILQELGEEQINQALTGAAEKQVPVTLAVRRGSEWLSVRSRILDIRKAQLHFEAPGPQGNAGPCEFGPSEEIGVTFKHKHHKYTFATEVVGLQRSELADGTQIRLLCVQRPQAMSRVQRRAYHRVQVPANRIVRVSFWAGDIQSEPSGSAGGRPVWSGRVMDISAGGFQVSTSADLTDMFVVGETVGLRISFGSDDLSVFAEAQFRHAEGIPEGALLGFQFVGLDQSSSGRAALQVIAEKVRDFLREVSRPRVPAQS